MTKKAPAPETAKTSSSTNKDSESHVVLPAFGMEGNYIMPLKDRHELKNIIEERYKAAMDESKLPSNPDELLAYKINAANEYKQSMEKVEKVFKGDREGVALANKLSDQYAKDKPVTQVGQNNNMDKALSQAMSDPEVVKGLAAASENNSPATSANVPAPVQVQGVGSRGN